MSLRSFLEPRITTLITSTVVRDRRRRFVELWRKTLGAPHRVHYFHQVDDPYSHLAAQLLEPFLRRYDVELRVHLVGPPSDAAAPERARLVAFSREDAARVAAARGLSFHDPGAQPSMERIVAATRILAAAAREPRAFAAVAPRVGEALWNADDEAMQALTRDLGTAVPSGIPELLARGNALREKMGHYLGAVFCYGSEQYWGVDRLGYLEQRLVALGASREPASAMLAPRLRMRGDRFDASGAGITLEFFPSLRSPYSYIAMERTLDLAARTGVNLVWRPVLPMVMRGLPVPQAKRLYITRDTKREADSEGVPFGRISDPVGRPVERAFSLYPWAVSRGRGAELLLEFCRAVWSRGVPAGTDDGMRQVVEAAGLPWAEARQHLDSEDWRPALEANREAMLAMGLWGVPSFRVIGPAGEPDYCTWGQDRLPFVEDEIRRRCGGAA